MNLITKYNVAAPRYTSYPTVPAWHKTPSQKEWKELVKQSFQKTNACNGISLYIHLPFCESLCTYCACNTRITVNHKVEIPYIQSLLQEWQLYTSLFNERPRIREIHLGGGTPTFFSHENLKRLMEGILADADICADHDFSFEGHPANTTAEHLSTLYDLGFRRVSFGVQDFDPKVQEAINRFQTFEQVRTAFETAWKIGYTSVNADLVYGLPFQTMDSVSETIHKIKLLQPDRIAFYSYAHVPWLKPGQRKFTEKDLPLDYEKRALYEKGLDVFCAAGYEDVGMDHFALPEDALLKARNSKKLHRNFMGYTHHYTELMISLGASSISDTGHGFAQNIKAVEAYQEEVAAGNFPIMKGHVLSEEDQVIRKHILNIMCKGGTLWEGDQFRYSHIAEGLERAQALEADGLVTLKPDGLEVSETGKAFLRNICLCFDQYYWNRTESRPVFSSAV